MGHGPAVRLTEASGRCRLGQATFAGMDGKGREAPRAATPKARPVVRSSVPSRPGQRLSWPEPGQSRKPGVDFPTEALR